MSKYLGKLALYIYHFCTFSLLEIHLPSTQKVGQCRIIILQVALNKVSYLWLVVCLKYFQSEKSNILSVIIISVKDMETVKAMQGPRVGSEEKNLIVCIKFS